MKNKHIAVVGATGAVGTEFLHLLEQKNISLAGLRLFASEQSAGKKIDFRGESITVEALTPKVFSGMDIAFFAISAEQSVEYAPIAVKSGTLVIDNSSAFRMDPDVPLVVPEVNAEAIKQHHGIIANPNCTTVQLVVALNPIHRAATIKRIVVSTYQAVSGSGQAGMDELNQQLHALVHGQPLVPHVYPVTIVENLIPQIDDFVDSGYTKEEMKMVNETRKILNAPEMQISATCVRVPTLRAHCESVQIETARKITADEARRLLSAAPGVIVKDNRVPGGYPTPAEVIRTYETYVGRIREDISHPHGLAMWVVADQLYKGAALNALQIAELCS